MKLKRIVRIMKFTVKCVLQFPGESQARHVLMEIQRQSVRQTDIQCPSNILEIYLRQSLTYARAGRGERQTPKRRSAKAPDVSALSFIPRCVR